MGAGRPPGEVHAFVEQLDAESHRRFEALGVARVVVNVPLDDVWRERLERVRGIARG